MPPVFHVRWAPWWAPLHGPNYGITGLFAGRSLANDLPAIARWGLAGLVRGSLEAQCGLAGGLAGALGAAWVRALSSGGKSRCKD
eukprot:7413360-Pyramimonas_sp.AAC.1